MPNALTASARHLVAGDHNLSFTERSVSIVGGLALAAAGAQPRPNKVLSLLVVLAGVALAIRGATGHCAVKAAMGDASSVARYGR